MKAEFNFKHVEFYTEMFIRLICLIFVFAFIDSVFQFKYLIGKNGFAPITEFLTHAKNCHGNMAFLRSPSLFWIHSSDTFIFFVFCVGAFAALLGLLGIAVSVNLLIAFVCWLSVINTGGDFFIYVWDTFLLEAGFIAFLISFINHNERYKRIVVFLVWLLIFRFWLSMGMEKLLYNNSIWMSGEYMQFYFQNQPMPTRLSFYMNHFPPVIYRIAGVLILVIEVILPFFIFFKRLRASMFIAFFVLSILIQLFGNYAWFNMLTVAVSLPILINTKLGERIFQYKVKISLKRFVTRWKISPKVVLPVIYFQIGLQTILLIMICTPLGNRYLNFLNYYNYRPEFLHFVKANPLAKIVALPMNIGADFKLANPYGVFKGIAVKRWELVFEYGCDSLTSNHVAMKYYYKPGLSNSMGVFAPHFPRLEQQLFYEAQQGSFWTHYTPNNLCTQRTCWTNKLVEKLLKGLSYQEIIDQSSRHTYSCIKVQVVEMAFNSWEDYKISGEIWKSKNVFSIPIERNSLNCPLIDAYYYSGYKKHVR